MMSLMRTFTPAMRLYRDMMTGIGKLPERRHMIAITFDDGNPSDYDAFKMMQERGCRGTSFIIGSRVREDDDPNPNVLTKSQIREMAASGWEIGCHTWTHPISGEGLPGRPVDEIIDQIVTNKAFLEGLTGHPVLTHAIPGGKYDENLVNMYGAFFIGVRSSDGPGITYYGEWDRVYRARSTWMDYASRTVASLKKAVDDFLAGDPGLLVISGHSLRPEGPPDEGDHRLSLSELTEVVDHIVLYKKQGVLDVVTFAEGIFRIKSG